MSAVVSGSGADPTRIFINGEVDARCQIYDDYLGRVLGTNDIGQCILRIRPYLESYIKDGAIYRDWSYIPALKTADSVSKTAVKLVAITKKGDLLVRKGTEVFEELNDIRWTIVTAFCRYYRIPLE